MLLCCLNFWYCCFTVRPVGIFSFLAVFVCDTFHSQGKRKSALRRVSDHCTTQTVKAIFIPIPHPIVECHLSLNQNGIICSFSTKLLLKRFFQCCLMIKYISSDLSDKQSAALFLLFPSRAEGRVAPGIVCFSVTRHASAPYATAPALI